METKGTKYLYNHVTNQEKGDKLSMTLMKKIENIEVLLLNMNSKLDNFLGFENMDEKERKELKALKKEVEEGNIVTFKDVFGE